MTSSPALRRVVVAAVLAAALGSCTTGCAANPSGAPAPTPCGGSHDWPPNDYPAAPTGLTVEAVADLTVRISNATSTTWTYRASAWGESDCVGWLTFEPAVRAELAGGADREVAVEDPGAGLALRIGVELWDHPCDDACTDAPTGFAWVDAPAPAPSG